MLAHELSDEALAKKRVYDKAYLKSPNGQEAAIKYRKSEKGKKAIAKYLGSEKGRIATRKQHVTDLELLPRAVQKYNRYSVVEKEMILRREYHGEEVTDRELAEKLGRTRAGINATRVYLLFKLRTDPLFKVGSYGSNQL